MIGGVIHRQNCVFGGEESLMNKNIITGFGFRLSNRGGRTCRALGTFADSEKIRFTAIATGSWGAYVPEPGCHR